MKWRTLSLRNLLFGVIGTLSLLLLTVAGMMAFDAWQDRETANDVVADNAITDKLLESGRYLIAERDTAAAALQTIDSSAGFSASGLAEIRNKADTAWKTALDGLRAEHEFAGKDRPRSLAP